MKEQDLFKLKQDIDQAKTAVAELKGQQTALLKQLKEEWKCDSIEDAEKKLKKMRMDLESLDKKIETGLEELEEKYHA